MDVKITTCSDKVIKHVENFDCLHYKLFITIKQHS
jgi:hypothetical protein